MSRKRSLVRRTATLAAAGAATLVLAACGGSGDGDNTAGHNGHGATASPSPSTSASASASASQGQHNAADVAFAKGMIPHHRQAVEMAGLAPDRAQSAEVKKLAAAIEKAQDPEIKTLSGWLTSWGEEVPAEGAMDHSTHDMGGMMTADEMTGLENSSGKAFDTAFLEMMIRHHEGAVEMAKTEQADGAHGPATRMAGEIISSQSAEIEQMNELLGKG
ncbi:DUF305 domain-containing protein [Streptomyces sp. CCM_MD2014]|uniref:DUF305 domain-containing protein n=1 Tax=Streptomyces sp. CCM_MD2014 TaxID=1561022 RepID=UPI00052AEF5E|nr:DUF305 domain-containing protein [Streptomyces sp. CCM_MD2014]AIV34924.1 copper resistance protein [Streptomyces sp. CCM_MD2014]